MKPSPIARPSTARRSQKPAVSAGSIISGSSRRQARAVRAGARGGRAVLMASRAEGPVGTKPGSWRAQPMQNFAFSRFLLPQAVQTTGMDKFLRESQKQPTVHVNVPLSVSHILHNASEA